MKSQSQLPWFSPYILLAWMVSIMTLAGATASVADAPESDGQRARYSAEQSTLLFTPLAFDGGSKLTLISPSHWVDISDELVATLHKTHAEYTEMFRSIPALTTSIRLMDEPSFFAMTGAPQWTNAMFIRGQIVIPIAENQPLDLENLRRSAKHEYSHAIISALSGGRSPGWLDEGLAQLTEGSEHPALRIALKKWLSINDPIPLSLLQGGFTKLNSDMVPPAYAQSLLAAKALMETFGSPRVAAYFEGLRLGVSDDEAFKSSFGMTPSVFEVKLHSALKVWGKLGKDRDT